MGAICRVMFPSLHHSSTKWLPMALKLRVCADIPECLLASFVDVLGRAATQGDRQSTCPLFKSGFIDELSGSTPVLRLAGGASLLKSSHAHVSTC